MEYLWLILAVIGLPILLLLRALRRLHDEPAVGFRNDIYAGRVQQAVRKVPQGIDMSLQTPEEPVAPPNIPVVGIEESPASDHLAEIEEESAPDNRKALIQALLLSEVLQPRSK